MSGFGRPCHFWHDPSVIVLSRRQLLALLVLCGAVILHATMWPYNFRFDVGSVPTRLLSATHLPFSENRLVEKKDLVLNVILFLPFGALLFLYRIKGVAASRSVFAPTLLGMIFSILIETTQCLLPTRTPSLVDICTNTLGALLGAIAARTSLRVIEETTGEELSTYLTGWRGYFAYCETPSVLRDLDSWVRRRLRCVVWKQWKRGRTRFAELRKRDVNRNLAARTAGSAHGPWNLSHSPALSFALPNVYFDSLGLPTLAARKIA